MLVGRSTECTRIEALLSAAQGGAGGALVLRGEPGVGKTALLAHARRRARAMTVLEAQGVEGESELPFAGISQLLAPVLDRAGALPASQQRALEGALGLGADRPRDRFAAYVAILGLLAQVADERPLVALVDDAHWLDVASVEALAFAARRLEAEPVALLLATRIDGWDGARLPAEPVAGLEAAGTAALLGRLTDVVVPAAVLERLQRDTGGNPLALVELAGTLSASQLTGAEPLPEPLPAGAALERSFGARLGALPDPARRALVIAAADDGGETGLLARALDLRGLGLAELAPAEVAGHVTIDAGRLAFRHPLLRSAAYYGVPAPERRDAHAALAAALDGDPLQQGRRAWHLATAALGPDEDVALALEAVAADAVVRGAPAAAGRALAGAARLSADDATRVRRLTEGARAYYLAGATQQTLGLLDAALARTDDPLARADIQRLRAQSQALRIDTTVTRALLRDEAARVAPFDAARAATLYLDGSYAAVMAGEPREALRLAQLGWPAAETAGGILRLVGALVLGGALILRGETQRGGALQREAHALLTTGELSLTGAFAAPAAQTEMWVERFAEAHRLVADAARRLRAEGVLSALPHVLYALSVADFHLGDYAAARAAADETLELTYELDQPTIRGMPLTILGLLAGIQGRLEEARERLDEAERLYTETSLGAAGTICGWARGLVELSAGEYDAAVAVLEPTGRFSLDVGLEEPGVASWAQDLAEAYIRSGRPGEAEATLAVLAAQADNTGRRLAHAGVERCRGLMAKDDADAHFVRALAWHDGVPCPFERARTELCRGERLRRDGRRADAREPLHRALDTFERLEAVPWAERTRSELRATGERVRRRAPETRDQLTPQELRVALIVAEGATNREAAATLFVTPKTIEAHLNNAYRKLGVRSRVELARHLPQGAGGP